MPLPDDEPLFCSPPASPRASGHPENYDSPEVRSSDLHSLHVVETPRTNLLTAASPTAGRTSVHSAQFDTTIRARGAPTPTTLYGSTPGTQTPIVGSLSVTDSTLSTCDEGPELAPLQDSPIRRTDYDNETPGSRATQEKVDQTRKVSTRRGRIVTVRLHEPVKYGTSAIAQRLFGGSIQEIQYACKTSSLSWTVTLICGE